MAVPVQKGDRLMGTKLNPGAFDCYHKALPDEPMFVLLARDPLAPEVVRTWARARMLDKRREDAGDGKDAKYDEAMACAQAMTDWRDEHGKPVGGGYQPQEYRRVRADYDPSDGDPGPEDMVLFWSDRAADPLKAIEYAVDREPFEAAAFLAAWREGDVSEWPEYFEWLARPPQIA